MAMCIGIMRSMWKSVQSEAGVMLDSRVAMEQIQLAREAALQQQYFQAVALYRTGLVLG